MRRNSSMWFQIVTDTALITRLSAFPIVWEDVYGMSTGQASLNYLSIGVGVVLGVQVCARYLDKVGNASKRHVH